MEFVYKNVFKIKNVNQNYVFKINAKNVNKIQNVLQISVIKEYVMIVNLIKIVKIVFV
jgi:hypothetical protein